MHTSTMPKGLFYHLGKYYTLMARVFGRPEKHSMYYKQLVREIGKVGISSLGIVAIISLFMGAIMTIQTAYNLNSPLLPRYLIGLGTRDALILEFSSTIVALILAGKVGSSIASELGTMRVSEQIDALEIMGINSASYLILPKIIAAMLFNPLLTLLSMTLGIYGGWAVGTYVGVVTTEEYILGIRYSLNTYYITYTIIKTVVFAFTITSISAYYGYSAEGGSVEVANASTKAVVYSSVFILMFNLLMTQLLLS